MGSVIGEGPTSSSSHLHVASLETAPKKKTNLVSYRVLLVSTYELGRQPFGLASPAAWLKRTGASVRCLDLSREPFRNVDFEGVNFVGFYLPMHTATRLAAQIIPKISMLNPHAYLCAYGLYAPVNEEFLRQLGIKSIVGGEFEEDLTHLVQDLMKGEASEQPVSTISRRKQQFLVPDRSSLPALSKYAQLTQIDGTRRVVGYAEASRGCKHLCRHCPIVPVYNGQFRIIQRDVVLEDIRGQVERGAQHITFGDPDFFNGIGHAISLVQNIHQQFPLLTYDATIKIEHLLRHSEHIATLKETGCAFVTSAVESIDDNVLRILDKRHTRADFIRVVELCRSAGLPLAPTFVTFTPWLTLSGYADLLQLIADLNLVSSVAPVQWAIRLLIPKRSRLLDLPEVHSVLAGFDEAALSYRWVHPHPQVDALQQKVECFLRQAIKQELGRERIFEAIWHLIGDVRGEPKPKSPDFPRLNGGCAIPYLTEPWFC
jgi:radical SAM superfamily enzyme YgiQ (UPF0313 family)